MFNDIFSAIEKSLIRDDRYKLILQGLGNTLLLSFYSIIVGLVIGLIVALIRELCVQGKRKHRFVLFLCNSYVNITRAMPAVVRLLIVYYFFFADIAVNKLIIGVFAFGLGSGAFVAEIIRSGIKSVDKSQVESAKVLGLNYFQRMRYVILPQATKNMIPALGNELIALIIETSIAGYIGINDLTRSASIISSRTFDYLTPLLIVAVVYIIIIFGLKLILNAIEKRLKR